MRCVVSGAGAGEGTAGEDALASSVSSSCACCWRGAALNGIIIMLSSRSSSREPQKEFFTSAPMSNRGLRINGDGSSVGGGVSTLDDCQMLASVAIGTNRAWTGDDDTD